MDQFVGGWALHEIMSGRIALVLGFSVIGFAPFGNIFKSYGFLTESLFAMLLGIAFGPEGASWFDFHEKEGAKEAFFAVTRLVLAIQVFNSGVFLEEQYLRKHWAEMLRLFVIGMAPMWLASSLCVFIVFQYDVLMSLLVGACFAATDPVLSSTVVKGKFAEQHLHAVVRESLIAESGVNDAWTLPFVMLPLLLMKYSAGYAIGVWFCNVILYRVAVGIVVGAIIGSLIATLCSAASRYNLEDRDTKLILLIAVSAFTMGVSLLMSVDEMVAVFAAGVAYNLFDNESDKDTEKNIDDAVDTLVTFTFYASFGAFIPWNGIAHVGFGKLVVLSVLIIFLRRLPVIPALKPLIFERRRTWADVIAIGFFGPIGAGGIFWAIFASFELEKHDLRGNEDILEIVSFVVVTQAVFYSLSTPVAARVYDYVTGYSEEEEDDQRRKWEEAVSAIDTIAVTVETKDASSPS